MTSASNPPTPITESQFPTTAAEAAGLLARAAKLLARLAVSRPPPRPTTAPPPAMAAPAPVPAYLDTRQAAALLGVSTKGLEAMRARGAGPKYIRVGNRVRYLASELPGARK